MKISKIISSAIVKGKLIIKILGSGKSDIQTVFNILPFGVDSNPNKKIRAIYSGTESLEDRILLGIIFERPDTNPGETRIYAEDSDGNEVIAFYFKNDGSVEMGGNINFLTKFNELKIGFDKLVSDHNELVSQFNIHTHPTAAVGPPSIPTPVPDHIPVSNSEADISASKSDILKTI